MMRRMGWFRSGRVEDRAPAPRWSRAQTMAEYALVVALVAVVVYAAYLSMGKNVSSLVNKTSTSITSS
jgi:Flp pilus assembly pilin Flp